MFKSFRKPDEPKESPRGKWEKTALYLMNNVIYMFCDLWIVSLLYIIYIYNLWDASNIYIDICIKLYVLKKCYWKDKWILLCIIKQLYNAYLISYELHKIIQSLWQTYHTCYYNYHVRDIFEKDAWYLEMLSNFYTYWDCDLINPPI
jgi:hypothetical protein